MFDKILSIQNVFTKKPAAYQAAASDPVKRQDLRQRTKKHGEIAGGIARGYILETVKREEELAQLDFWLDLAVETVVRDTTDQLCGDRHLENDLKESLAPRGQTNYSNAVVPLIPTASAAAGRDNNDN